MRVRMRGRENGSVGAVGPRRVSRVLPGARARNLPAVGRVAACGLMGTGRTLNGTREVSAVFDFRFRARYEPQLVLKSVYATLKPLHRTAGPFCLYAMLYAIRTSCPPPPVSE